MKTASQLRARWLWAAFACAVSAPASAQLIVNGGFEAGFTGWTRADQVGSDGTFALQTGTTSPVNGFPVPAPPEGIRAAMTDAEAGGSHVLYQDFVVPVGIGGGTASFALFVNSGASFRSPASLDWAATNPVGGLNLNQQARVDILTATANPFSVAAGDVLLNLFQTNPGDPLVSGYNNFSTDISSLLSARQGQTLRLRFAEVDNVFFFNLGVDRVAIEPFASVPEPTTLALLGLGLAGWGIGRRGKNGRRGE